MDNNTLFLFRTIKIIFCNNFYMQKAVGKGIFSESDEYSNFRRLIANKKNWFSRTYI